VIFNSGSFLTIACIFRFCRYEGSDVCYGNFEISALVTIDGNILFADQPLAAIRQWNATHDVRRLTSLRVMLLPKVLGTDHTYHESRYYYNLRLYAYVMSLCVLLMILQRVVVLLCCGLSFG